ncbi:DUF4435 domain-containing protein [Rheinheimera hassiensis]|uniref:DUF4435 domain-containing protein n=1 Tax=Rheinheimera hassiensis TaxID=1193627 RepID=UPI001F05AA5A|nr:DUF4435 domain-containing protein [Rheinheimera hassiensis]
MNNKSLPTVDEIVNSLKRSFIPTILIEGSDDLFVYRWLKSSLNNTLVSLQPCGGRTNLFSIYDRRSEFEGKNVVFVADRDAFRFIEIPKNKSGIIFTTGYCIENDIYGGSDIHNFVDHDDKIKLELLRGIIGKWVAFEVSKTIKEREHALSVRVSTHINVVSPPGLNEICPQFSKEIGYTEPEKEVLEIVYRDYNLNVRGKQLFQMLSRFLAKKGRFSNFSDKNLIEIALKQGNNILLNRIVNDIKKELQVA